MLEGSSNEQRRTQASWIFIFTTCDTPPQRVWADAGADQFTLSAILGHSDIRMTERYTHATDEAKRRAVEKLVTSSVSGRENEALRNGRATAPALYAGETPAVPVSTLRVNVPMNGVDIPVVAYKCARFGNGNKNGEERLAVNY